MRLTVVLTVHDGERFLGEAIDSVLAQSRGADEIIAVDDGSRDGSAGILASYAQIRVIAQAQSGCAVARNRGVAAASGDVIALLDQDDVWDPDKLRLQTAALEADPALGFAVCAIRNFLTPGLAVVPDWVDSRTLGVAQRGFGTGTLVLRQWAFAQTGPFDPTKAPLDDSDWFVRAVDAEIGYVHVNEAVVHRRIHDRNLSGSVDAESARHSLMARILHASLARRRQHPT